MKTKIDTKEIETKHLAFPLALKSLNDDGLFAGYASVFDVIDSHKDIIVKGAFARSLQKSGTDIKLLWQHKVDEPIGIITKIREDAKGLYVEGKLLLDVRRAEEAYALLKSGALEGMSIGYTVREYDIDDETGVRILTDIDLWEVSLVTFPANTEAGVTHVKGEAPATVREFEHFLRDAGFSRKQAKFIAVHGFDRENQWDAGDDLSDLAVALDRVTDSILGN
jgi:HK97 family phage prohead protease